MKLSKTVWVLLFVAMVAGSLRQRGPTVPDVLIPPTALLNLVGFRIGDPNIGSVDRTSVYLHVYDDFSITAGGAVDTVGGLVAVSTNSINLEILAPTTDLTWTFALPSLSKDTPYHYVMASDTSAATTADPSNLLYSDLQVGVENPYLGGQAFHQTGDLGSGPTSEDLFFRVISTTGPRALRPGARNRRVGDVRRPADEATALRSSLVRNPTLG